MQDETLEEIVDTSDARGARVREASVNENEAFPSIHAFVRIGVW